MAFKRRLSAIAPDMAVQTPAIAIMSEADELIDMMNSIAEPLLAINDDLHLKIRTIFGEVETLLLEKIPKLAQTMAEDTNKKVRIATRTPAPTASGPTFSFYGSAGSGPVTHGTTFSVPKQTPDEEFKVIISDCRESTERMDNATYKEACKSISTKIKPVENSLQIQGIFSIRNGLGLKFPSLEQANKAAAILKEANFAPDEKIKVRHRELKLVVLGIPSYVLEKGPHYVVDAIRKQNPLLLEGGTIHSYDFTTQKKALILKVDAVAAKKLLNSRVYVDTAITRCEIARNTPLCFRCGRVGHIRAHCRNEENKRCFNCNKADCVMRPCMDPPQCGRCNATDHNTFQFHKCPMEKDALERLRAAPRL